MVLEATMLCIDNSDHVRNSDYLPSRLQVTSISDFFRFCAHLFSCRLRGMPSTFWQGLKHSQILKIALVSSVSQARFLGF